MFSLGSRRLLLAAAAGFAVFLLVRGGRDTYRENYKDFLAYAKGGMAFRSGEPLYFQEEPSFKYSPFFALLIAPLTLLGLQAAYALWIVLMLAQLFLCLRWSRTLLDSEPARAGPSSLWLYGPALLISFNFTMANFDKGQADIFVFFWIVGAWLLMEHRRDKEAGVCLAVGILTKVSPIVLLPFLLWRKKWACVIWCGVGLVFLSSLPWIFQGPAKGWETTLDWYRWTRTAQSPNFLAGQANQSLLAAIHRLFTVQTSAYMVEHGFGDLRVSYAIVKIIFLVCGTLTYAVCLPHPVKNMGDRLGMKPQGVDFAAILIAAALIFPMRWKYAFVSLIVPIMAVLLYTYRTKWKDTTVTALFAFSTALMTLVPSIPIRDVRVQSHYHSVVTWGILLLGLAVLKIKHFPLCSEKAPSGKARPETRSR